MRAQKYKDAVGAFNKVIGKAEETKPDLVAEAMFWCAESWLKIAIPEGGDGRARRPAAGSKTEDPLLESYKMYKRLTWDYPASKWAKYARGRLASAELARAESGK